MRKPLKSRFAEIADLDPKAWAGSHRQLKSAVIRLRSMAGKLDESLAAADLLEGIGEVEASLYRMQCVSQAINLELMDITGGLEGFIGMLDRLDDEALSSTELCCLLRPSVIALDLAVSHHNDLNA